MIMKVISEMNSTSPSSRFSVEGVSYFGRHISLDKIELEVLNDHKSNP